MQFQHPSRRGDAVVEPLLIAVATHGRTGLSRIVLGSIATRVIHQSHCPVLVTPVRHE